jgi:hypothetical protein
MHDLVGHTLAAASWSTARCRFCPMVAGASKTTTPSGVVRKTDRYTPSVTQ